MNVGITGAGGFVGRRLVATIARSHAIRALVHRIATLPDVPSTAIDLADPTKLAGALDGLDAVVHAGAYVPSASSDPAEARACLEINGLGTLAMLQAAVQAGVRRFVLLSGNIYRPGTRPVTEDDSIGPSGHSPYYLASKAYADAIAEHFRTERRLEVVTLRPSAVYGPGMRSGMIPTFVERLTKRERIVVADGGRYRADLVHVDDVAQAALSSLGEAANGPYNVGSGSTASSLEIAELLARITAAPRELIDVAPAAGEGPIGFSPLAIGRAQRDLAYAPRSLEVGLADYVRWWESSR